MDIVCISDRPELMGRAAQWFHEKWGIPLSAYLESMEESVKPGAVVPKWYVAIDHGDKMLGGLGVIENDFHDRKDLSPNVCAVYVEEGFRGRGIAGKLLERVAQDMSTKGIGTLYLLTNHDSFYERYGWSYLCPATSDGEERPSRLYIHVQKS